jgi:hypothetical protein
VELLRTRRISHAVDLNHDEPQFGQRLRIAARRRKAAAAHAARLRSRINVVDDRILLRRVELVGHEHQAVQIGHAVARLQLNGTGGFQPEAISFEMSAFSSVAISLPAASRTTATGGTSGFE